MATPARQGSVRDSKMAIVFGILAWIPGLGLLFFLPAIIYGILALARRRPKPGLAIAGIVLGATGFFVTPIASAIIIPRFTRSVAIANRAVSVANLRTIAVAIELSKFESGQYPRNLQQLVEERHITEENLLYPGQESQGVAYGYLPPAENTPGDTIIVHEHYGFDREGRNVLLVDGTVKWMPEDQFWEVRNKIINAKSNQKVRKRRR